MQTRLLPQRLPRLATLECAAHCVEVSGVGGDGYDFIDLGGGRMAVVLADVSGKGMAAALLWATLQATVRSQAERAASDIAGLLAEVNRAFIDCSAPERYATLFMGVYDDATRRLRYVNCGHNPPLLLRADGACGRLPATAPVIGVLSDWNGDEQEIALAPGDTLLLYSDGVTEAGGARGAEFGEDRLAERLKACRGLAASLVPAAIVGDVQAFAGAQDDDITVLALRGR